MKPNKLTLQAFGPFVERTEIDFTKLNDQGVYLISGPTGSGKTTLFDALCYALYGESSGGVRQADMFRSDYARAQDETFVELVFEHDGKTYTIRRNPNYIRESKKSKKGDKLTSQKSGVLLSLPDGSHIEKTALAKQKIEEILGMKVDNFRQMVMIAQNDFKKMFEAKPGEQAEIFRQIFNTSNYRLFQEKLKEGVNLRREDLKESQAGMRSLMTQMLFEEEVDLDETTDIHPEMFQAFSVKAEEEEKKNKQLEKKAMSQTETIQRTLDTEKAQYSQALKLTEEFEHREACRKRLEGCESEKENIQKKEKILEKAQKARTVESFYEKLVQSQKALYQLSEKLTQIENESVKRKETLENQKAELSTLEEREADLNEWTVEMANLEKTIPLYESVDKEKQNVLLLSNSLTELAKRIRDLKGKIEKDEKELSNLRTSASQNDAIRQAGKILSLQIEQSQTKRNELDRIQKEIKLLEQDEENCMQKRMQYKVLRLEVQEKEQGHKQDRMRFLDQQAILIRSTLKEGKPCPVCGSLEHEFSPETVENLMTQERLNRQEKELENLNKRLTAIGEEGTKLAASIKTKTDTLLQHGKSLLGEERLEIHELVLRASQETGRISENIKEMQQELTRLKKDYKQCKDDESKLAVLEETLKENKKQLEASQLQEAEKKELYIRLQEKIASISKDLTYDSKTQAQNAYNVLQKKYLELSQALKEARETLNSLHEQDAKDLGEMKSLSEQRLEEEKNCSDCQARFNEKLKEESFENEKAFTDAILTADASDSLQKEINDFWNRYKSLQTEYSVLENLLEGQDKPDLNALLQKIEEKSTELAQAQKKLDTIRRRLENNEQIYKELNKRIKNLGKLLVEYEDWLDLSKLVSSRGENFEQYVQSMYFDQIVQMANIRLSEITGGRYQLQQNAQQSFALDVFDRQTGKIRSVKTLSGGESFQACLCMALGVSDIVQAMHGGIRIETIFVDEGFGSLDEQALEQAVRVLTELSGERQIGIISHVTQLKEQILDQILIQKGERGSRLKLRCSQNL